MDPGFIDLRQNQNQSGGDQNFWPSFTDIMTVIVMIFILASTLVMVRNWQLVSQLRASIEAEQRVTAERAALQETSTGLESRLAEADQAIAELQMRNLLLEEQNAGQAQQISDQVQQILALTAERDQIAGQRLRADRDRAALDAELTRIKEDYRQVEEEYRHSADLLQQARTELAQQKQARMAEIEGLRQERAMTSERLETLQAQYARLDAKYQKLLRPARSAEGKQVAEVRYLKQGNDKKIELRLPGEAAFQPLSAAALHQRLATLKENYGKDLYVRIIIPPDSGLSYNDAWDFTRDVLNRYDYYFQE